jgi:hypothetical protein
MGASASLDGFSNRGISPLAFSACQRLTFATFFLNAPERFLKALVET